MAKTLPKPQRDPDIGCLNSIKNLHIIGIQRGKIKKKLSQFFASTKLALNTSSIKRRDIQKEI